ncbi:hypothetical protein [Thalassospira lucentensis]|uniref:hypothetical protein n=1 Tax=Thalassospira lucentensis TaxID=168935 RepID=UPI00142D795C|nr:hypothetical protein [Thalassospira lucentensis]
MKIIQSKNILYLISVLFFLFSCFYAPLAPVIEPDSSSYINFSSSRTPLYPLIISSVLYLLGDIYYVSIFQILVFSLSSLILMRELLAGGFKSVLPLLALVLFLNPFFWHFHIAVLTDSLFLSFTILICAALLALVRSPQSMLAWLMLGAMVGASVMLRPVGFSFFPMIPLTYFYVFDRGDRTGRNFLISSLVVALMVFAAGKAIHYSVHGVSDSSLASRHLFAKSALISAGEAPFPKESLHGKLWNDLEANAISVRNLLDEAVFVNPGVSAFLLRNYEVYFQYRYISNMLTKYPGLSEDNLNEVIFDVGLARLKRNPIGYIGLTARHFSGLWQPFSSSFSPFVAVSNSFIERKSPLPFNENNAAVPRVLEPRFFSYIAYPSALFVWMGASLLLAVQLICFVKKRNIHRDLVIPLIMSLMVNGNFLLISLLGVGIGRYSLSMFVPMFLMSFFLLRVVAKKILVQTKYFPH